MITLTAAIAVPNIQRVRLHPPQFFDDANQMAVRGDILSSNAAGRIKSFQIWVRNGRSDALLVNSTPTKFDEDIKISDGAVSVADAYDQAEAAYRGGATKVLAVKALEQKLIDLNIIQLVGTVG